MFVGKHTLRNASLVPAGTVICSLLSFFVARQGSVVFLLICGMAESFSQQFHRRIMQFACLVKPIVAVGVVQNKCRGRDMGYGRWTGVRA